MSLSWHRIVLFVAAIGILAATASPLSTEPAAGLFGRPMPGAAILLAAALYIGAAFLAGWPSIAATFAGVLLGCWATMVLLNDDAIAGYAAWGFWLPVLANWIAAWAGVASLAAIEMDD